MYRLPILPPMAAAAWAALVMVVQQKGTKVSISSGTAEVRLGQRQMVSRHFRHVEPKMTEHLSA